MIALLLYIFLSPPAFSQEPRPEIDLITSIKTLYAERRWEEIIQLTSSSPGHSAELDLYRGLAMAQLQRWDDAKTSLMLGYRKDPQDKRFPLELAGIAYRQNQYSEAKNRLNRALRLDPNDTYARDFLASIYLLENNLEAALQHWNRIEEPQLTRLRFDPQPRLATVLLERAIAFPPVGMLDWNDLLATKALIENTEVFPNYRFELVPDQTGSFTMFSRLAERNGWGDGYLDGLLLLLRGIPYQAIQPEFYNLNRSSINLRSMVRWDAQKRRLFASLSTPLVQEPKWRFEVSMDGKDENWDIRETFRQSVSQQTDVKLKKIGVATNIRAVVNGRWSWSNGVSVSYRNLQGLNDAELRATPAFTDSFSVRYGVELQHKLLLSPERRLTVDSAISGHLSRGFSELLGASGGINGSLDVRWFPLPQGEDYEMQSQFRIGSIFGQVPLDELFTLGIERDNELGLRGHIGTRNGRKGSAPMGRQFVLWNWEADKIVHQNSLLTVKLGPFLDVGKVADPSGLFGSGGWLWDPGLQCKVRVLGSLTFVLSYGKDLRSGRNALYTNVSR